MIPRIIARSSGRARPVSSLAGAVIAMIALVGSLLVASPAHAAVGADIEQAVQPASQAVDSGIVKTAAVVGFNAENIISDALFYDNAAMTAAEIQAFLDAKIGTCNNGKCLNVLNAGISSRGEVRSQSTGNLICSAIQGGTMKVSELIYRVQVACGISAKVILVTLQKEQGLTTSKAPSDWNLSAAMGASCPDTAPCDPAFAGVGPQILKGTQQLMTYKAARFGKQPGVNFIGYSPNSACGGTNLNIQNYATAALYTYTPYQPNGAALAAGFGLGDACSAYGNRNFYNYYTQWFGSTQGDVLQILQVAGTSERYLVSQGLRWRLATADTMAQYTWLAVVREVSRAEIDVLGDRGTAKRAVRTETGDVYLIDGGQRKRLGASYLLAAFGWDYASLPLASNAQLARYPDAGYLEQVVSYGGQMWLMQGGVRRQILDLGLLPRYGIPAAASAVSAGVLSDYSVAMPVVGVGTYRDTKNTFRLMTDAGVFGLPPAATGTSLTQHARLLTDESIAFLAASTTIPVRLTSGGKSYVLLDGGWLEVAVGHYPAGLPFTTLPNGAAGGLPIVGYAPGPHFISERSDAQSYLVSGGGMQSLTSAERSWVTAAYGVNPRVWVALDGTLGDSDSAEGVVRTANGAAYLLDGVRAYRFGSCAQVASWGADCATVPTVADAKVATYANAGYLQHLVRTPAGTIWLPQGGQLRQVLDPGLLAVYGIPSTTSTVSAAALAPFSVGPAVLSAGVYSDGGTARSAVTEGGTFTLTQTQAVGVVSTSVRALTTASFGKLTTTSALPSRIRSDGRSFVLTTEGWLEVSAVAYGGDSVFTQLPSRAWTGIPVAAYEPRPHFVRDHADGAEYLVSGGSAQPVSGAGERATISARYGVPPKVWTLAGGVLDGVRVNHDLVAKDATGAVYLLDGSMRYLMNGCTAVISFGRDCASVRTLTSAQLGALTDGGALEALLRSPKGLVYLPQGGTKRETPDPRVLAGYGIGASSTPVSEQVLAQLPLGYPVVGVGVFDDRAGGIKVVTGDARIFTLPAAQRIGSITSGAWTMSRESLALLVAERDLPTRITAGSRGFVLTSEGWLAVGPAAYAPLSFSSIGTYASDGIRFAGAEERPHFVREQSSTQVYLASGGLSAVADDATRAWIVATYGVSAKVWVVPDGALR